jgi:hypothetical protein
MGMVAGPVPLRGKPGDIAAAHLDAEAKPD